VIEIYVFLKHILHCNDRKQVKRHEKYGYASEDEQFSLKDPTEVCIMEVSGKG
jgi:hypothetical protein